MKKSVFIFGETGRMGQEIISIVNADDSLEYAGGFSREKGINQVLPKTDIIIDFSLPETLPTLIEYTTKTQAALVSGTTGLQSGDFEKLKTLGKISPVFWAANMSFGVYLMCQLTEMLAKYESFYRFSIEETHHIHKKDKPSGTALIVAEAAKRSTDKLETIDSIREGEVFGIHRFMANSKNESIEIRHEAFNRGLFAQGAVDISKWVVEQQPGFYSMDDFFQTFTSQA